jgi:cytidine deaminase
MPDPTTGPSVPGLDAEDAKLVVLARAARGRAYAPHTGVAEGAAVRDTDGRTYAAATVEHAEERLSTSAVRGALSAFASSGARALEAAVVVTDRGVLCADDVALLGEFGGATTVSVAGADGVVRVTTHVAALLAGSSA